LNNEDFGVYRTHTIQQQHPSARQNKVEMEQGNHLVLWKGAHRCGSIKLTVSFG